MILAAILLERILIYIFFVKEKKKTLFIDLLEIKFRVLHTIIIIIKYLCIIYFLISFFFCYVVLSDHIENNNNNEKLEEKEKYCVQYNSVSKYILLFVLSLSLCLH